MSISSQPKEDAVTNLVLFFRGDDLAISGNIPGEITVFEHHKNPKEPFTRFYPRDYHYIIERLNAKKIPYQTRMKLDWKIPIEIDIKPSFQLYPFQKDAVDSWLNKGNGRGIIVIPTGGGKTFVALNIINRLRLQTLIVVPTLVLLDQWKKRIKELLGLKDKDIGMYGGGKKEIAPCTIITYDSAHLYNKKLRDKFGLMILDEAHHLSGTSYQIIADGYLAKYRLALTATLDKDDTAYTNLIDKGFDTIVYEILPTKLQNKNIIANYEIETIKITSEQSEEYRRQISIYSKYISDNRLYGKKGFQQIIFRVNRDPKAEAAIKAFRKAREIAFSSEKKIGELEKLLEKHDNDKMIIFSDFVSFCELLARTFLIPCITNRTSATERKVIMERYRRISNAKLITSRILDEGVDIPDANIAVIVAGSGQTRQFIQRLGRILRIHPDKKTAKLYEIISIQTMDERAAVRRKKKI